MIQEACKEIGFNVTITKEINEATIILGLQKHLKENIKINTFASSNKIPIYTINIVLIANHTNYL